jgi:hypothetical protein
MQVTRDRKRDLALELYLIIINKENLLDHWTKAVLTRSFNLLWWTLEPMLLE